MAKTYSVKVGHEYKHLGKKDRTVKVLFVAKSATTNEDVVVYRNQFGTYQVHVRTLADFTDFVDRNGYRGPRYMEVKHP